MAARAFQEWPWWSSDGWSGKLTWLVFVDAVAVGVLALADLTAHEATTEKVVHQLVVDDGAVANSTAADQRTAA
jgi:hypothetical protein